MLAAQEGNVRAPEDRLVERCRAGDVDAFSEVYTRYERQVFRYAYHLLGHRDDADDVKQETFLRAYRAFGSFRSDCSLNTWLLKICGNLCRDRMKMRSRRKEVLYDPQSPEAGSYVDELTLDPYETVERSSEFELAALALRSMPEAQREIIVLYEVEQMSYQQIATVLNCSLASVKLRLFRARKRFRERIESLQKTKGL